MHSAVSKHLGRIADLCRRHGVVRLEVFGSAARASDFNADSSDVDCLVEFAPPNGAGGMKKFFAFRDELRALLARKVDLVESKAVSNTHFAAEAMHTRETLYAA
jgi:predicted nucleotidyltransferase